MKFSPSISLLGRPAQKKLPPRSTRVPPLHKPPRNPAGPLPSLPSAPQLTTREVHSSSPDQHIISIVTERTPPPRVSAEDRIPLPSSSPNVKFFMSCIRPRRVNRSLVRVKRTKVFNAVKLINRLSRATHKESPLRNFLSHLMQKSEAPSLTRAPSSETRFGVGFLNQQIRNMRREHSEPKLTD